jgi:translocon-associated protein subunit delta
VIANQVGYISVFTLNCKSQTNSAPLFAEVNGQISSVLKLKDDQYQFSWTEDKAKSGNREVKLYDEELYAAWRKQQRAGETPSIKPLATITVNHNKGYGSLFFVSSEMLVLVTSFYVSYIAFQNRSKLASNQA